MDEMSAGAMDGPLWEKIKGHLAALEFDRAAELLMRLLPELRDPRERVVCYQLLASACWTWAAEQRIRGHEDSAAAYRDCVRQTYHSALSEFPFHPGLRVGMALFSILGEGDPQGSLRYLEPVPSQQIQAEDEQRRLAVRGVALALLGSHEDATETLLAAYGDPFTKMLPRADISPLGILVKHSQRLPADVVGRLIASLGQYREANAEQLELLRKSLTIQ